MAVGKTKKKWYSVVSPTFKNAIIGETLGSDEKDLVNRKLDVNYMSLTNDPKSQNVRMVFKIKDIKDNNVIADVVGYELTLSYVKRLIRKGSNKVVDSFIYDTKDNTKVIIKPLIITRYKTNKGVLKNIRKSVREFLTEEVKKYDYNDLINLIAHNTLQRALREKIKSIYVLSSCEFRIVKKV